MQCIWCLQFYSAVCMVFMVLTVLICSVYGVYGSSQCMSIFNASIMYVHTYM